MFDILIDMYIRQEIKMSIFILKSEDFKINIEAKNSNILNI
jgi:hypothetical protein